MKLIVTRGPGARGYGPPEPNQPTRILSISGWPSYPARNYADGIAVRVCALRLAESEALAGLKHLCRLEQVLAQLELRGSGADQGLLLDNGGRVVGGTSSNVFAVRDGVLLTPALTRCGIKGVMRRVVLETAAELGIAAEERDVTLAELEAADELFMTNALIGIWPVALLDGRSFSPAFFASCIPLVESGTSTQPVNRFSRFHCDSPCLSKTKRPIAVLLVDPAAGQEY